MVLPRRVPCLNPPSIRIVTPSTFTSHERTKHGVNTFSHSFLFLPFLLRPSPTYHRTSCPQHHHLSFSTIMGCFSSKVSETSSDESSLGSLSQIPVIQGISVSTSHRPLNHMSHVNRPPRPASTFATGDIHRHSSLRY